MSLRRRTSSLIHSDSPSRLNTAAHIPEWSVDETYVKRKSVISSKQAIIVLLVSIAPWIPLVFLQRKIRVAQSEVEKSHTKKESIIFELISTRHGESKLSEQVRNLQNTNSKLLKELKQRGDELDPNDNQYETAEVLEGHYLNRIEELEMGIRDWSLDRLQHKYNMTQLKFQVHMINTADRAMNGAFTLETLPIENVPHSTFVFHEIAIVHKRLINEKPMPENGTPCFTLQSTQGEPMPLESIQFPEISRTNTPETEEYGVIITRKGMHPAFIFCSGKHYRDQSHGYVETLFARVVSGTAFLDSLAKPVNPSDNQNWRVQSVDVVVESLKA